MSRLAEEIENALLSDCSSDAVRVWLWLRICHGGEAPLSRLYDMFPNLINSGIEELVSKNLIKFSKGSVITGLFEGHSKGVVNSRPIRRKRPPSPVLEDLPEISVSSEPSRESCSTDEVSSPVEPVNSKQEETQEPPKKAPRKRRKTKKGVIGSLEGRDKAKAAFENPKLAGADRVIEDSVRWVWRRYNAARLRQGVKAIPDKVLPRQKTHVRKLAKIIIEEDIAVDEFFDFAYDRTRWQKNKFPSISTCSGAWILGEWGDRADGSTGKAHAGAKYAKTSEDRIGKAKEIAERHGHELDRETLEYLIEQAETLATVPHHYTPDPEFGDIEHELAEVIGKENDMNEVNNGDR